MAREIYEPQSIVENISPRDKEVILLASVFFWTKYMRRKINFEGFEPVIQKIDFDDPMSILRTGFDLHRQANSDIDGDVVEAISDTLSRHPMKNELFPHLSDEQVKNICGELNSMFENQESCALCESWSYYDEGPEDFAINVAETILYLNGRRIGLSWYADIYEGKNRQSIIETVLRENLVKRASGLLPVGRKCLK